MSVSQKPSVDNVEVKAMDADQRLDRWLRRNYPGLTQGRIEKLLRTGYIRLDGKRAAAGARLQAGQIVTIPSLLINTVTTSPRPQAKKPQIDPHRIADLKQRIIYQDESVLVLDKPAGLAVQGGTGTDLHLDGLLDYLKLQNGERPRLVHRLDRDTSGVLILAHNVEAARRLTRAFSGRDIRKLYLAITAGVPAPVQGRIDLPLAKAGGTGRERIEVDIQSGQKATSYYAVIDHAGKKAALVALLPVTGRTHQLRVHCAAIGTPIVGDRKYGGDAAILTDGEIQMKLHLHAAALVFPHPKTGASVMVKAPLSPMFRQSLNFLGLEMPRLSDPFEIFAALDV